MPQQQHFPIIVVGGGPAGLTAAPQLVEHGMCPIVLCTRGRFGVPRFDLAKPDEIGSPWYAWLQGGRAINYRWQTPDGQA